jgi:RHS repeat-associated protein
MTVAGQPQVTYTYDNANRLTQIAQGTSAVTLGYDNANRRTSLAMSNGVNASYTYDNDSRVTGITYNFNATMLGNLTYSYDELGRRTQVGGSFAQTALPQSVPSAVYDAANQLTNWNGTTIGYDLNGNMLSDGANTFSWNARNQVASLNGVALQYDAFGRRIQNLGGTSFLYDGANAAQELSGTTPTANLLSGGIDEIFSRSDSSGTLTPLVDALGSTIALVDSSGNLVTSYAYEPFGGTVLSGQSGGNAFQYTGRENEGNGLYFYRARYYSPALGRFTTEDPLGLSAGPNPYAYALGNPISFSDPSGLRTEVFCRPLHGPLGQLFNHCYVRITPDGGQSTCTFGLHREKSNGDPYPGGARPVRNDLTDFGGNGADVADATPEKERLFAEQAMSDTSCPSCGWNYSALTTNSNYWVWDSLKKAGMTPPDFPGGRWSPGYGDLPPEITGTWDGDPSSPMPPGSGSAPPMAGRKPPPPVCSEQ